MKTFLGVFLILLGLLLGAYVGVWVMFIGGIVQIIEAIKTTPVEAMDIAIGSARVFFSTVTGAIAAYTCILPGWTILNR